MVTIIFPTAKLKSAHWPFCLVGFRGACSALVSTSCPERPWKPSPTKTFHSPYRGRRLMSSKWRRFEVLLPLRFNDGRDIPAEWIAEAVLEIVDHFGAASYETQWKGTGFTVAFSTWTTLCGSSSTSPTAPGIANG
jgi:hypothetical protein